jgi:hypothetical protein
MKKLWKEFKCFITNKSTFLLISYVVLYQIFMIGIYIPSYWNVTASVDKIVVAIINEDNGYGKIIASSLTSTLPTAVISNLSKENALQQLNTQKLGLIIYIPTNFTASLQDGQVPEINYYENGTTAAISSGIITSLVTTVQNNLKQEFASKDTIEVLKKLGVDENTAASMSNKISVGINSNTITMNNTKNMQNQMAPLFLTLAGYACGLICAPFIIRMIIGNIGGLGKTRPLIYGELLCLLLSLVAPIGGIAIFSVFSSFHLSILLKIWFIEIFITFASLQINLITNYVFSIFGNIIGVGVFLAQIVASGALFSREMMLVPMKFISHITPLYYSINEVQNYLFSSGKSNNNILILLLIVLILTLIVFVIHGVKLNPFKSRNINKTIPILNQKN